MSNLGRHGGAGSSPLSKVERQLQKKGISNMTLEELHQWYDVCERNEQSTQYSKARRTWKRSRIETEERIEKLST